MATEQTILDRLTDIEREAGAQRSILADFEDRISALEVAARSTDPAYSYGFPGSGRPWSEDQVA
jgi:hypothetical protein